MKTLLTSLMLLTLLALPLSEARSHRIHAYRRAGHAMHSYHRMGANHIKQDNYSYHGNYNPWSDKRGHRHY